MAKISIVSHSADLDGVASAYILCMALLQMDLTNDPKVFFADYDNLLDVVDQAVIDCEEIFILDLSQREPSLIDKISLPPDKIHFFDHHPDSIPLFERWKGMAHIVLDVSGKKCTADLVWETYKDKIETHAKELEKLVSATHSIDLWIRDDKMGEDLTTVISLFGAEKLFNDLFEHGVGYSKLVEVSMELFNIHMANSKLLAVSSYTKHTLDDISIYCALSNGYTSYVAEHFLNENEMSIIALIDVNRMVISFRTSKPLLQKYSFGMNDLAKYFGGGGHKIAAGGKLSSGILHDGVDKFAYNILSITKEIIENEGNLSIDHSNNSG